MKLMIYFIVVIYGLLVGSFLNVCIIRLPKKESLVLIKSHCVSCGYQLRWYDLFPVFSYVLLKGRCRKCHTKISIQYPLIEALNAILYLAVFLVNGIHLTSALYCLVTSALLALSIIDLRTFEIPFGINLFLAVLGIIRIFIDYSHWYSYIIGFFASSGILFILYVFTSGKGIGGGDIKLMAASGLILGWKMILLSLGVGAIVGSVIHMMRMKFSGKEHILAFGPYLSIGIFFSMLFGEGFLQWYYGLFLF